MNGKFPRKEQRAADTAEPRATADTKAMPYTYTLDEIKLSQGSAKNPAAVRKRPRELYEQRERDLKKLDKASLNYINIGRPLDHRFAQKVHGAALAPPWEYVWTDDTEISTDVRANLMESEIRKTVTEIITAEMKHKINKATEAYRGPRGDIIYTTRAAAKQQIDEARESARELIPRDTKTARLSNLVLDLEEVAVNQMRNFAAQVARRGGVGSFRMMAVVHQLDLARYGYDVRVLCRSLRRDDLTFSTFGHLVGALLCESLYTKGTHAVNYMQLRVQRKRVCTALQEAVGFLLELDREVLIDKIGQPDGKQIFSRGRKTVFVAGDSSSEAEDTAWERAGVQEDDASQAAQTISDEEFQMYTQQGLAVASEGQGGGGSLPAIAQKKRRKPVS